VSLGSGTARAAVPPVLLASTVQAGMLVASGQAVVAVVSASVVTLTEGVLKAMLLTKLKSVALFLLVAGALVLGLVALGPAMQVFSAPPPLLLETPPPRSAAEKSLAIQDQPNKPQNKDQKDRKGKKPAPADRRARAEEVVTKSFTTKKSPRLVVDTFNGAIEVTTGAGGSVRAKVIKRIKATSEEAAKEDLKNVDVKMIQEGDTIRISAKASGHPPRVSRAAAVELQVPPGAALQLHTSNGKVTASGAAADVDVQTTNGKIEVKGARGKVRLKTSNGSITTDDTAGPLDLHLERGYRLVADRAAHAGLALAVGTLEGELTRHLAVAGLGVQAELGVGRQGQGDAAVGRAERVIALGQAAGEVDGPVGGVGSDPRPSPLPSAPLRGNAGLALAVGTLARSATSR
jgi:hypothetical protein